MVCVGVIRRERANIDNELKVSLKWKTQNVKRVISRYLSGKIARLRLITAKPNYSADRVEPLINTSLDDRTSPSRWVRGSTYCEYCMRVDRTRLLVSEDGKDELRECTFEHHTSASIPEGAVIGNEGGIYISPYGHTCHYFLSNAG
jgi:hypothetical protein